MEIQKHKTTVCNNQLSKYSKTTKATKTQLAHIFKQHYLKKQKNTYHHSSPH